MTANERNMSFLPSGPPLALSSLGLTVASAFLVAALTHTHECYWEEVGNLLFWPAFSTLAYFEIIVYVPYAAYVGALVLLSARPSRSTPAPHEVRRGTLLLAVLLPGAWIGLGYLMTPAPII